MLYIFSLPSVKVGRPSTVIVGVYYLFATLSERWYFIISEWRCYDNLFLPSMKVGWSPSVNFGDYYLFATLNERW